MDELDSLNISIEDKKEIVNTIEELRQYPYVNAVILFGSYAKGRIKPLSDIDISVIAERNVNNPRLKLVGLW